MIIIAVDHALQCGDQDLKVFITEIAVKERVTLIAEENRPLSDTVARRVSGELGIRWIRVDMSFADRIKAGIEGKLFNRMQLRYDQNGNPIPISRYAPIEDGIREEFWLDRIQEASDEGTVLVVCGCWHCVPLAEKAAKRGHKVVAKLFYPENLSEMKPELY